MNSMTGYGQAAESTGALSIDVSVRTVNSRFLDIRCHLPKKYMSFESELVRLCKGHFTRGTCDVYVQRQWGEGASDTVYLFQKDVAQKWLKDFRKSLKDLKVPDTLNASDLLQIPDFIRAQEVQGSVESEKKSVLKALKKALEANVKERTREGLALQKTCLQHLKDLRAEAAKLRGLRSEYLKEAPEKLKSRLEKLLQGQAELDPTRWTQEIAYLTDRSDIEEELNRLQEHMDNVESLLKSREVQGKKLDFYAQELLREVNTIGSKSSSAKIVEVVVSAKNCIEQLREQVQNIE